MDQCSRSIFTTASCSDEEQKFPPVKKSKFECGNCVDDFHILTGEHYGGFMNPLFMEMITFTLRSISASADGVSLNINIEIPAFFSLMEVMTRFSKKLSMSMDRLLMRCNGRELGVQEEVRGLANQTVWLTVVEVKEESV